MRNGISNKPDFDAKRALKEIKHTLRAMTPEQHGRVLVKSGILTKAGRVAKPYRDVIKPMKDVPEADRLRV